MWQARKRGKREKEGSSQHGREEREEVGSKKAMVLGLSGMLEGLLASVVPAPSAILTFGTELVYFSCQPECEAPVHSSKGSEYNGGKFCEEMIEVQAGVFWRWKNGVLHELLAHILHRQVFSFQV